MKRFCQFFVSSVVMCVLFGCASRQGSDKLGSENSKFPGFVEIESNGKPSTFFVDMKSVKYDPGGLISFKFVETFSDGSYVLQMGAITGVDKLLTAEAVKYSSDGKVVGKTPVKEIQVSDNSQGVQDLLCKVRQQADLTLKVDGVASIINAAEFLKAPAIKALLIDSLGADAYKLFNKSAAKGKDGKLVHRGAERFVDCDSPQNLQEKHFAYFNLLSGRCVAGCIDDSEVSIFGAESEQELPDLASAYLERLREERSGASAEMPFTLHFLKTGEAPVQAIVAAPMESLTESTEASVSVPFTSIETTGESSRTVLGEADTHKIASIVSRVIASERNSNFT